MVVEEVDVVNEYEIVVKILNAHRVHFYPRQSLKGFSILYDRLVQLRIRVFNV